MGWWMASGMRIVAGCSWIMSGLDGFCCNRLQKLQRSAGAVCLGFKLDQYWWTRSECWQFSSFVDFNLREWCSSYISFWLNFGSKFGTLFRGGGTLKKVGDALRGSDSGDSGVWRSDEKWLDWKHLETFSSVIVAELRCHPSEIEDDKKLGSWSWEEPPSPGWGNFTALRVSTKTQWMGVNFSTWFNMV